MNTPAQPTAEQRLHIGGIERREGWLILNAVPGDYVDIIGDVRDLSRFSENSFVEIYASHVLEHIAQPEMVNTLKGIRRILAPGGKLYVSVPDLDALCWLFLQPDFQVRQKYQIMRMMYGGQTDAFDYHAIGLNFEFMADFMASAGFKSVEQVPSFGLFNDASEMKVLEYPISLNVVAIK